MSVTSSLADMKTTVKSDSVLTINNNFKEVDINDGHSSLSNGCGITSSTANQSEQLSLTMTDNLASDSHGELVTSQLSDNTDDVKCDEAVMLNHTNSVDYLKERAIVLLQEELQTARKALQIKDEECKELNSLRSKVGEEIEELTASLFQEAHKMVNEANMKQYIAEKRLNEASGEIEALKTEVSALKSLVLTSTPSNPNPECHPQLIKKKKDVLGSPLRKPRILRKRNQEEKSKSKPVEPENDPLKKEKELDMVIMDQLTSWLNDSSPANESCQSTTPSEAMPPEAQTLSDLRFLERIEKEDVVPCLTFKSSVISQRILDSVRNNALTIEPLPKPIEETCALTETVVLCKYQIKCGDSDDWLPISQGCRARIASVCDYMTYIRYVEKKIVKHTSDQMYWEINRLREEMSLAKLGHYKLE